MLNDYDQQCIVQVLIQFSRSAFKQQEFRTAVDVLGVAIRAASEYGQDFEELQAFVFSSMPGA